jgi:hypothetical protein
MPEPGVLSEIAWFRQLIDLALYAVISRGVPTMRILSTLPGIATVTFLALVAWHVIVAQDSKSQGNCTGLHAGITAQLMQATQGYSEPSVMVAFHLLNDSENRPNHRARILETRD